MQQLTPDQFEQWKLQREQEREQASDRHTRIQSCMGRLPMLTVYLQAKVNAERQGQADIDSGRASMTGVLQMLCLRSAEPATTRQNKAPFPMIQVESCTRSILSCLLTIDSVIYTQLSTCTIYLCIKTFGEE